jgi:hypothetical protein
MDWIPLFTITHHYKLPKQMGGGRGYSVLGMFLVCDNGLMIEVVSQKGGKNLFGKRVTKPSGKGYKFEKVTNPGDFLDVVDAVFEALEFESWLNFMEDRELTIADIEGMKPGESIEVIMLHRNLGDVVLDPRVHPFLELFEAKVFFKEVRGKYTHVKDLHGILVDELGEEGPFNFHLNYFGKLWYPLGDDGLLPVETGEACVRNAIADYRRYPKTTKVGWRGPMLRVSDLDDAPMVYHKSQRYTIF